MSSAKPLVWIAILGAVGFGVYTTMNKSAPHDPPPGVNTEWGTPPPVQLGDSGSPVGAPTGTSGGIAPRFSNVSPAVGASAVPASSDAGPMAPHSFTLPAAPSSAAVPPGVSPAATTAPNSQAGVMPDLGAPPLGKMQANWLNDGSAAGSLLPKANGSFADGMAAVQPLLKQNRLAEALKQLSVWCDDPRLTAADETQLFDLLDQLAGAVIYSRQHLLEPPYRVKPGDKLADIAQQHQVPVQLLANINGIQDPTQLAPGSELKMVTGPFSAVVNTEKHKLTLHLNGCYAGRFPIGVGQYGVTTSETIYTVSEKRPEPTYQAGTGPAIASDDPRNPFGKRLLGLSAVNSSAQATRMALHGSNEPGRPNRDGSPGYISLSQHDAQDVFDILSEGSRVTILPESSAASVARRP